MRAISTFASGSGLGGGAVGDLLSQPAQGERDRVGLRLGHVDPVGAEPGADLLELQREGR